jgi:GH24 family phage-related lysozyme (muramidase)
MARQWTAKQAIDAQNGVTPPVTPVAPVAPTPINTPAPVAPAPITPPTVPAQPRVEWQWNYGTADNQVLAPKVETPSVSANIPKPATAKEAITQGFKQEIKPVDVTKNAPLTTEIGREAKLGQLPTVQQAQNQAEQDRINTSNLKSQSGNQLWSNLESISSTNTSLLNDRNAFNKAFGYDGKDVSEKALVDAFWKSKRLDANSIYNSLATGTTIPNESKNTPAFTDALIRHQDTTRFENLNPYQLSKVINTELIPWTQTYNDLMAKNPQLVTDAMKLASINTPVTARQETTNWQDNLSNYLSRSPVMSNPTTVASIMNSDPNIATKTNEVQAVEDKLTEAKDRLKNIQKNVTERYKGTGATKQTVNAKALAESQDIIDEITMLEANKASASSALTTLIQNAKDNYTMARQDRQDALAQYNQGFQQLQAMAEMGMKQDSLEYQKQQDSVNRDLQLLQYYTNIDQANAKEARGYQFQEQSDLRNFDQQKELAKMGYNQAERMSSINYNQDINKLRLTNDLQTNKDLQTRVMDMRQQGYSDQDIQNTIYGGGNTQQNSVADFIKGKEWFRDQAYDDATWKVLAPGEIPKGVATLWYGFTSVNGKPVKAGDTIDQQTADSEFNNQIQKYQNFQNLVTVPLSESQKAALTSFEYNLGGGIWKKDAMPIITAINNGDLNKAGQLMQQYNKAGGKFVQGLANRRAEEAQLLMQSNADSIEQNLTPLAKSSYQSKTLVWTPTQQSQILAELTRKWLIGNGEWNANLYQAKPADKKEMVAFIQWDNLMRKADEIIQRRVNDGTLSEMFGLWDKYGLILANKLPNAIKLPNEIKMGEDFKALQTILGKELSSYMKEVSGATVADDEVARLMKQIPSLDEWSSDTFLSSWNSYKDTMNDAKKWFVNQYWFNDMPTAAKVLLWTSSKPTQQTAQFDTKAFAQDIINSINNR